MLFFVEKELSQDTINQIVAIAQDYTADYFTENVPEDVKSDLLFQRAAYLKKDEEIIAFVTFTCLDGCPHMTLLATKRIYSGMDYGRLLMQHFVSYITELGFHEIELMTVLPESKPVYSATIRFYESIGFKVVERYPCLWDSVRLN